MGNYKKYLSDLGQTLTQTAGSFEYILCKVIKIDSQMLKCKLKWVLYIEGDSSNMCCIDVCTDLPGLYLKT